MLRPSAHTAASGRRGGSTLASAVRSIETYHRLAERESPCAMVHAVAFDRTPAAGAWAPSWVESLVLPVWVSGPDRTLRYVSPEAERLFERSSGDLLGRPCHEAIRACRPSSAGPGPTFCARRCPLLVRLEGGDRLAPQELCVTARSGATHFLLVLALPVTAPGDAAPSLVHLGCVMDRAQRLLGYVQRLAARTPGSAHPRPEAALTPRELQILELLSRDVTPRAVALRLGICHATVRNHVQHLLHKLGAHSIEEAVALFLTRGRT